MTKKLVRDFEKMASAYSLIGNVDILVDAQSKGSYCRPLETSELSSSLIGDCGTRDLDDYFEARDKKYYRTYRQFRSLIPTHSFSPRKEFIPKHYFVRSNTIQSLDCLIEYLNDVAKKKNVLLIGDQGSGKTITQNMWLLENKERLEQEKIIWVRCDCLRLYEIWMRYLPSLPSSPTQDQIDLIFNRIKLKEYLDIQLIYVFSKYCLDDEESQFGKIFKKIRNSEIIFDYPSGRKDPQLARSRTLHEVVEEFNAIINKEEKVENSKYSYAVDQVILLSHVKQGVQKRKWLKAAGILKKYLSDVGYKIIQIVDGADNVPVDLKSSEGYYKLMLSEVDEFIRHKPSDNIACLTAIRSRTYQEAAAQARTTPSTDEDFGERRVTQEVPSFEKIFKKRLLYATNIFKNKSDVGTQILLRTSKRLINDSVNRHHNNIREFLSNKTSMSHLVYYRMLQLGSPIEKIDAQLDIIEKRNLFLNGMLYLDSKNDLVESHRRTGCAYFNMFYYDQNEFHTDSIENWYGLCVSRILQIIIRVPNVSHKKIKKSLSKDLNYPKKLIDINIKRLREYGLINTTVNKANSEFTYTLNAKANYFIEDVYTNLDFMYFMGLDIPLPKFLLEKSAVQAHRNYKGRRTNFPSASVVTSLSLVLILKAREDFERRSLSTLSKNLEAESTLDICPVFQSRIWAMFNANVKEIIRSCDVHDKETISNAVAYIHSLLELEPA